MGSYQLSELKLGPRPIGDRLLMKVLLRIPAAAGKPTLAERLVAPMVDSKWELGKGELQMSELGGCRKLVGLWH